MKYSTACSLLEISEKDAETLSNVNKQYRKMCLKYHPDKNGNVDTNDMFLHVKEAYDILLKNVEDTDDIDLDSECETTYEKVFPHPPTVHAWMERLKPVLQVMGHITESSGWSQIIQFLSNASKNNAMQMLEKMDKEVLLDVYNFLCKHRRRFPTAMDGLIQYIGSLVNSSLHTRTQHDRYVVLYPKLEDLLECNVYKHVEGGKTYIIPTWMEESVFDWSQESVDSCGNETEQNERKIRTGLPGGIPQHIPPGQPKGVQEEYGCGEFIVNCIPICPEGVMIDENHHVHMNISMSLKEIWDHSDTEPLTIELVGKPFAIKKSTLSMMKNQQHTIYGKGIPIGNSKDVFDVCAKGNIVLHITIS